MPQSDNVDSYLSVKNFKAQGMPKPVNFDLNQNNICMVSGVSGSGKSQFFKALADLIEHQGQAEFMQQSMDQYSPEIWRSQIMYFSAETAWWDDQVALHFDILPTTEMLQKIGLSSDLLNANPDALSSGEKQRLALLRGLQYRPKVLLLDEITANLDPKSEQLVEQMVADYVQQNHVSVLWISHDPAQTSRMANQTMVFSETDITLHTLSNKTTYLESEQTGEAGL